MSKADSSEHVPLGVAVLTVSDTRTEETDTSGHYLVESLTGAGHRLADKAIVIDDIYQIRAQQSRWIADATVQAVLVTQRRRRLHRCLTNISKGSVRSFGHCLLKR